MNLLNILLQAAPHSPGGLIGGNIILLIVILVVYIFVAKKFLEKIKQKGENYRLWLVLCIIGVLLSWLSIILMLLYIFIGNKKENTQISHRENKIIPTTCPSCKSPNAKKTQICEWCGNEIY